MVKQRHCLRCLKVEYWASAQLSGFVTTSLFIEHLSEVCEDGLELDKLIRNFFKQKAQNWERMLEMVYIDFLSSIELTTPLHGIGWHEYTKKMLKMT